jgi:hypothetical protein
MEFCARRDTGPPQVCLGRGLAARLETSNARVSAARQAMRLKHPQRTKHTHLQEIGMCASIHIETQNK